MPIAQLHISVRKKDDTIAAAAQFNDSVERMSAVVERTEGFVWRLLDEDGDAKGDNVIGVPKTLVTLSVCKSAKCLEAFVLNTVDCKIYNRKAEWFDAMQSHHFVMWYVEEGHRPTLQEAKERLDYYDKNGNSDHAFGWAHLPHVKLWQQARCG